MHGLEFPLLIRHMQLCFPFDWHKFKCLQKISFLLKKNEEKKRGLFNETKMKPNLHSQAHFHSRSCSSAENSLLLQWGVVDNILFLSVTFIFLIFPSLVHRCIQTVPVLVFFLFHRCGIVSHCKLLVPFPQGNRCACEMPVD